MKRFALLGVAILLIACDNGGEGRLRAHLLLPPASPARAGAFRTATFDSALRLDTVRVSVLDGARVVARQEAPVSDRSLEILSLPEGTYTVRAEALVAGTAVLAGSSGAVDVKTGAIADTGDIRLAPITPAMPVVKVVPAFTREAALQLRGAKEMFTGILLNGKTVVDVDDSLTFTAAITLREGGNDLQLAAVNPDGVAGAPFAATITLDTVAPTGSLAIARGAAQVAVRTVAVELTAEGADEMRVGEQADLSRAAWTAFTPSFSYALAAGDGLKTLYAQFRDRAGNESAVVSDSVTLRTAPTGPQVLSATPADATNGTIITISGMALGVTQGSGQVVLGGAILTVLSWSDTQLTLLVGPTVAPGPGTLIVNINETPLQPLTIWVYPTITGRTPSFGASGVNFAITGANLGASAGARDGVYFGESKSTDIIAWSPTLIQGVTPFETPATETTLTVRAGGLASAATTFTGTRPWIESRSPRDVTAGSLVTVYGRNFGVSGNILINGVSATPLTWTTTRVDALVPAGQPAGNASIMVMVGGIQISNKVSVSIRGSGMWIPLDDKPFARGLVTGVWTGTELLVWGGAAYSVATNDAFESGTGHRYNPATDAWLPMNPSGAPTGRRNHTAVWTGKEMIVYGGTSANQYFEATGGRYNPYTDMWTAVGPGDAGRTQHTAVWTGNAMIVWGGYGDKTGSRYDPASNTWLATSGLLAPSARHYHSAVWTGQEMIVFAGVTTGATELNDGGRYNPDADTWLPLPAAGAPTVRYQHTAVWTGEEMIPFGGCCSITREAAYNPRADTWRALSSANAPSSGRWDHRAVWTGAEMIVLGSDPVGQGGRYNPKTDTWMPTAVTGAPVLEANAMVWTGKEVLFWGGYDPLTWDISYAVGGRYDPAADNWSAMAGPAASLPAPRGDHVAVWTGSEMIVWGGYSGTVDNTLYKTGGRYNPATDTWLPTSTGANVPSVRSLPSAHWTGADLIIWGGDDLAGPLNDGARYVPATDSWNTMNNAAAPVARSNYASTSAGSQLFMWGGWDGSTNFYWDGGVYDPAGDFWSPTTTGTAVLSGRKGSSAVWTGSQVIVWGGWNSAQLELNDGAAYDVTTDTWMAIAVTNAPSARHGHYAVWTGAGMVVFSGTAAQNTGGVYDASLDQWTPITPIPVADTGSTVVAMGLGQVFVYGGDANGGSRLGYVYDAGSGVWTGIPTTGFAPFGRNSATAVWTGTEVILWGGLYDSARNAWRDGARYLP